MNIARNACIDYRLSNPEKFWIQPQEIFSIGGEVFDNEANIECRCIALKLEHKYRQVIDLIYFCGYSREEVSQILNISLDVVKETSRTGLEQLRSLYQNENKDS